MTRILAHGLPLLIAVGLCGCAADQAEAPAKLIGGEVAKFHADLSQFADGAKASQGYSTTRITGSALRTASADETTTRLQTEWSLQNAKTQNEVFDILKKQASADIAVEAAGPPPLPALTAQDFPLDKLGAVAGSLDQIAAQKDFKDNLKFLIGFATTINGQLQKLEADAAKKASAGK